MDVDLYLACRTGASNIPNILYENLGNGTFRQVADAGGAAGPVGIAVASGAGTADSVVSGRLRRRRLPRPVRHQRLQPAPLGFGGPNKLFRNKGNGNRWIELDLVGTKSDRDAVGARVYATANGVDAIAHAERRLSSLVAGHEAQSLRSWRRDDRRPAGRMAERHRADLRATCHQ